MSKYIVTWTEPCVEANPYYSANNSHLEAEYYNSTRERHKYLSNDKDLEEFVVRTKSSAMSCIRYYLLDKQIYPKLQITMQL